MIREYYAIDNLWAAALEDIFVHGRYVKSRNGGSGEVIGWAGRLENPMLNLLQNVRRAIDPAYACAEVLWYLSRSDDVEMISAYAPQYEQFAEPSTHRAYGAYGKRIAENILVEGDRPSTDKHVDQLDHAAHRLKTKENDRQVVVTLWRPDDLVTDGVQDKPCTVCLQYNLRGGLLYADTYMRSNDVWLGLPYDVFAFTCLQALLAGTLGCKLGHYTHHVGSLHLYDKHRDAASEAFSQRNVGLEDLDHRWLLPRSTLDDVRVAVAVETERMIRTRGERVVSIVPTMSMLSDMVRVCGRKFQAAMFPLDGITSPLLKKGLKTHADHRRSRPGRQDDAGEGAG